MSTKVQKYAAKTFKNYPQRVRQCQSSRYKIKLHIAALGEAGANHSPGESPDALMNQTKQKLKRKGEN